jgi:hypothetical protein
MKTIKEEKMAIIETSKSKRRVVEEQNARPKGGSISSVRIVGHGRRTRLKEHREASDR